MYNMFTIHDTVLMSVLLSISTNETCLGPEAKTWSVFIYFVLCCGWGAFIALHHSLCVLLTIVVPRGAHFSCVPDYSDTE